MVYMELEPTYYSTFQAKYKKDPLISLSYALGFIAPKIAPDLNNIGKSPGTHEYKLQRGVQPLIFSDQKKLTKEHLRGLLNTVKDLNGYVGVYGKIEETEYSTFINMITPLLRYTHNIIFFDNAVH
jgi:hypothetical protein